ncbi:MAG: hypothetical protein J5967_00650 [Oscillospiraceae bacterium]|nr:hypothetical protein [Oscillospiraceae bacterium]
MKKLLFILLLLPLFVVSAHAETPAGKTEDIFQTEKLTEGLGEDELRIGGDLHLDGQYDTRGALGRLWEHFRSAASAALRESVSELAALSALLVFTGLAAAVCESGAVRGVVELLVTCGCALTLAGGIESLVGETLEAMYRISDYSKAALPVVFTAAAAGGAVTSAGVRFAAVSFALDMMMTVSQRLLLPLITAYLALTLAGGLFPNSVLSAVGRFVKWAAGIGMTVMALSFTAYLGLTSAISTAVDASAVKLTRTVLSGTIPVVGGMLSDVSAMVLSAAGVVRNSAGAFGLVAVCALCMGPFAVLSVKSLLFKAAAVLAESVRNARMSALLSGVSSAVALLLGMLGCNSLMLFLSFALGMKAVTGV